MIKTKIIGHFYKRFRISVKKKLTALLKYSLHLSPYFILCERFEVKAIHPNGYIDVLSSREVFL
ncbi:hypothetical protein [Anaerotignum propionicum]|uniref:Uncharacterized protein n=1 Tax=Anaerotignum propionicum DSM 1682 TaxID=991789 RepID=A0A0X1U735_ANAPI|nr:hypothetical protein [Anaerotignum propionicum]AMJ40742.1 hypothetical protein CPRO_11470 [Anaerotignum propionicum DSM 1682]SHF08629.1 hypothetical protein SAMN02745151_02732 [[Clostridium] propionicum DSM 1682] [Anaerotignum propionicum DSM 1682]